MHFIRSDVGTWWCSWASPAAWGSRVLWPQHGGDGSILHPSIGAVGRLVTAESWGDATAGENRVRTPVMAGDGGIYVSLACWACTSIVILLKASTYRYLVKHVRIVILLNASRYRYLVEDIYVSILKQKSCSSSSSFRFTKIIFTLLWVETMALLMSIFSCARTKDWASFIAVGSWAEPSRASSKVILLLVPNKLQIIYLILPRNIR
jgi:hypothetical protein